MMVKAEVNFQKFVCANWTNVQG